jgi:hypothetical protein
MDQEDRRDGQLVPDFTIGDVVEHSFRGITTSDCVVRYMEDDKVLLKKNKQFFLVPIAECRKRQ